MPSILNKCTNSSTPLNISDLNKSGTCDSKCEYNFKYQSSSCATKNNGTYISISYDSTSDPPVTYNSHKYNVNEIRIYTPSIHTYTSQNAPAEIVIIHTPVSGGNNLLVSIPINTTPSSSKGSTVISNIITETLQKAPNKNETVQTFTSVQTFTLNDIVPKKPFFSYSGPEPFDNCLSPSDYIVFTPTVSDISISPSLLINLRTKITNSRIKSKDPNNNTPLFGNDNGPNNNKTDEDIYIDCQPVNHSKETVDVIKEINFEQPPISPIDILRSTWFQVIAGSLGFLLLICVISAFFSSFGNKSSSSSTAKSANPITSFLNSGSK